MISSYLPSLNSQSEIKGILKTIRVLDITELSPEGDPSYFVLVIQSKTRTYECRITSYALKKSIPELFLPSELQFKIFNQTLDSGIHQHVIDVPVIATVANYIRGSTAPLISKIRREGGEPKSQITFDKKYLQPAPEDWPEPDQFLPFVPISVPTPPYSTRIGYAVFDNPINYITSQRSTQVDQIPAMRLPGTIKRGTGKSYESYSISFIANGPEEIERSVKQVFEQIALTPFTTVEGGPFGLGGESGNIPHKAIAVRNFSIQTIDGFPNSLQVEITFDPFNWQYYIPPVLGEKYSVTSFDDAICWPLVKIWSTLSERSYYEGQPFNGKFNLYFPNEQGSKFIDTLYSDKSRLDPFTDKSALESFKSLLSGYKGSNQPISSRNIKEVMDSTSADRIFILKVSSKHVYDTLIKNKYFVGLSTWKKFSASNASDHLGNFIPESAALNPLWFTSAPGTGVFISNSSEPNGLRNSKLTNIVEIPRNDRGLADFNSRIASSLSISLDDPLNPQTIFGLVFLVSGPEAELGLSNSLSQLIDRVSPTIELDEPRYLKIRKNFVGHVASLSEFVGPMPYIDTSVPMLEVDGDDPQSDIIIERIGGTRGHTLSTLSQRGDPLPIHQYMGGMDATFIVQGKCFGKEACDKLYRLKEEFDLRALNKKSSKYSVDIEEAKKVSAATATFLYVDNEVFHLLGVNFAMPVTLEIASIDGQPDVWGFTLSFIEFNPELKSAEEIKFLPTTWEALGKVYNYGWDFGNPSSPVLDRAIEYFNLQDQLAREEVYKDLSLPTKGELIFWISTLQKAASLWDNTARSFKTGLTNVQLSLASIVSDQFFPKHASTIASEFKASVLIGTEPSAFSEPDFYVWYNPDESFGNYFDKLSATVMGDGPQHTLNSDGTISRSKSQNSFSSRVPNKQNNIASYREYDPEGDYYTAYNSKYFAGNAEDLGANLKDTWDNYLFPLERANKLKESLKKVEDDLDATENQWWRELINRNTQASKYSDKKLFNLSDEELQDMSRVYSDPSVASTADVDPILEGSVSPYWEAGGDGTIKQYFTKAWKQKMLRAINSYVGKYTITSNVLKSFENDNNYFFVNNPHDFLPESGGFLETIGRGYAGTHLSDDFSINDVEEGIKNVTFYFFSKPQKPSFPLLEDTTPPIVRGATTSTFQLNGSYSLKPPMKIHGIPWIVRSAMITGNFKKLSSFKDSTIFNKIDLAIDSIPDFTDLYSSWSYIDHKSFENQIDPNIIRAVFLTRTGYGVYSPRQSLEKGFGDFLLSEDPKTAIDTYINRYNYYAKELNNIPSLVLTALELEFTDAGSRYIQHGKINEASFKILKLAAAKTKPNRFSENTRFAISEALNHFPEVGFAINRYFGSYISLCRIFGSYSLGYMDSWRDIYFHGFSKLILIDTKENTEIIQSTFNPLNNPGQTVPISMNRGRLNSVIINPLIDEFFEGYNKNDSSLELEEKIAQKMQGAIEPHSENALYGSLVDFRSHAPFGKLRGAFPSFQILIINEGFYWNGGTKKLWDQFYTRTGVASIEVHSSRHQPGQTASVTFSNMFHNITSYSLMEALAHKSAVEAHEALGRQVKQFGLFNMIGELWNSLFLKNVPEDARKIWQNNQLKRLALTPGARLQIRMGYGSNASTLPVVFTGNVIDAPVSDGYVTISAVSDGAELEKPTSTRLVKAGNSFAFQDGGPIGMGSDPSVIVKHAMIAASWWDNLTGGNFRDQSGGVSHFGEMVFSGVYRYSSEIEFNLYSARKSKIEQGISEIADYNIVNGLVNWGGERNLFSVSVNEPTPWKVMEVCRRACSDFVAASAPFALRSTVFFGKWWWPYHFTYDKSILKYIRSEGAGIVSKQATIPKNSTNVESQKPKENTEGLPPDVLAFAKQSMAALDVPVSIKGFTLYKRDNRYEYEIRSYPYFQSGWKKKILHILKYEGEKELVVDKIRDETLTDDEVTSEHTINYGQIIKKGNSEIITTYSALKEIPPGFENQLLSDGLLDVTTLQGHLRWKPYMQAYIAHSAINLLDNNIKADSSKVVTDAIGMHQYNGWLTPQSVNKTTVFSVDTDIHPSDRKTMMVDTGILLTGVQAGTDSIAGGVVGIASKVPVLGGLFDGAANYISENPTTPAIENSVISSLVDSVKEMYSGWFTMQGLASIKPKDLILLTDHITDLKGPVFVKDVVHRMDTQTGFITLISPDAVVLPHDSVIGKQMITSLSAGILHRIGAFYVFKSACVGIIQSIRNKTVLKGATGELSSNLRLYNKILKNPVDVSSASKTIRTQITRKINFIEKNYNFETLKKFNLSAEEFNKLKKELVSLDPIRDFERLLEIAKSLGVPNIDTHVKNIPAANRNFFRKLTEFEEKLKQEIEAIKANREKSPISQRISEREFNEAADRLANERRAKFISGNKDEAELFLSSLPSDLETKKELKRLKELEIIFKNSTTGKIPADLIAEHKALTETLFRKIKEFDLVESDITDVELRKILKFEPLVFADGKKISGFKAAWESLISTPKTLAQGSKNIITGILDEALTGAAKRTATIKTLGDRKYLHVMPTPILNLWAKLKNMENEIDDQIKTATKGVEERIAKGLLSEVDKAKEIEKETENIRKLTRLKLLDEIKDGAKASVNAVRLFKYMGPQAILSVAIDATIFILGNSFIEGHNARLRARQCVKIIPLRSGNLPYVAGIKGHQGAVIGDSPSWTDELVMNLHGVTGADGSSVLPTWMTTPLLWTTALLGVDVPSYGATTQDAMYIEKITKGK